MTNSKKALTAVWAVVGSAIAVIVCCFLVTPKSTPISTPSTSGPIKITQTRIPPRPVPPRSHENKPEADPCKHPKLESYGYVVTGVVAAHFYGTEVDAISLTTKPPVRIGVARMFMPRADMARGDTYVKDFTSCDAGKTWKDGNIYFPPGPRMNEQQIEMMERAIIVAR